MPRLPLSTLLPPLALSASILLAAGAACYDPGLDLDVNPGEGGGTTQPPPPDPTVGHGLPCDLARMLNDSCAECHANPPRGGALTPLVTRADLIAPALSNPQITLAEDSLLRMQDARAPMPPEGLLGESATAPLAEWIADGMPEVACDEELVAPDDPYDTPLACTSGRYWTDENEGDEEMRPGHACIACHADPDAFGAGDDDDDKGKEEEEEEEDDDLPQYSIAGTVYPTAHEPNDCYGVDDALTYVIVEDADGVQQILETNEAGNFFTETQLRAPYRVKVVRGDEARAMSEPAPHGDCNVCHTEAGLEDAPGRIMAP